MAAAALGAEELVVRGVLEGEVEEPRRPLLRRRGEEAGELVFQDVRVVELAQEILERLDPLDRGAAAGTSSRNGSSR